MSAASTTALRRWLGPLLALAFIAALTLRPAPRALFPVPVSCLVCGDLGGVDVILNVALFIPLGAALVLAGLAWRRAAVVAMATTLLVETLQFTLIPGRDATLSDLLTNTLGGTIGALLATHWRAILAPPAATARWISIASALGAVAVLGATAALLRPAIPGMGMWGQWTPQQLAFEPYSGTVHSFRINDIPVPYDLVPESEPLRQRLLTGETRATVDLTTGGPTRRLSAIARAGSRIEEVFLIGARGTSLVFRTRLAVNDWRLRVPGIRLPNAFPVAGERVVAMAGLHDHRWYATVLDSRGAHRLEVPFSPALGWAFIFPFDLPLAPGHEWLSALWLAALAFPAAFWGAQGHQRKTGGALVDELRHAFNRWWLLATEILLGALLLIPRIVQFESASRWEWIGLAAGCVAGSVLASYARARLAPS